MGFETGIITGMFDIKKAFKILDTWVLICKMSNQTILRVSPLAIKRTGY